MSDISGSRATPRIQAFLQRYRKLDGHHLRARIEDRLTYFDGEFHAPR
jgi:hypothetical protein